MVRGLDVTTSVGYGSEESFAPWRRLGSGAGAWDTIFRVLANNDEHGIYVGHLPHVQKRGRAGYITKPVL